MTPPNIPTSRFSTNLLKQAPKWFGLTEDQIDGLNHKEIGHLALFGNLDHIKMSVLDIAECINEIPDMSIPSWLRSYDEDPATSVHPGRIEIRDTEKRHIIMGALLGVSATCIKLVPDFWAPFDVPTHCFPKDWMQLFKNLSQDAMTTPKCRFAASLLASDHLIRNYPDEMGSAAISFKLPAGAVYDKLLACDNSLVIEWIDWIIQTANRHLTINEIEALLGISNPQIIPPSLYPGLPEMMGDLPINLVVRILNNPTTEDIVLRCPDPNPDAIARHLLRCAT